MTTGNNIFCSEENGLMKPGSKTRLHIKNNPYVHTNPIQRDKNNERDLGTYTRRGERDGGGGIG